jgi:SAM-dependent methyltransferase
MSAHGHGHGHGGDAGGAVRQELPDVAELFTAEFWDERYGSTPSVWSGNANQRLVERAADLAPGAALDVGCGEGADAIWLAAHGWRVTGVDVSRVALSRAAARALEVTRDPEVAARIAWRQADLFAFEPEPGAYDLVSAHFMQLPSEARPAFHAKLAAAVRPGGSLLVVGHDFSDLDTTMGRLHLPDLFFTAGEVVAGLDPEAWEVLVADALPRPAVDPDGNQVTVRDAVVHAVRRA